MFCCSLNHIIHNNIVVMTCQDVFTKKIGDNFLSPIRETTVIPPPVNLFKLTNNLIRIPI